jgi:hypothetical protein
VRLVSAGAGETTLPRRIASNASWVSLYINRRFHILLNGPAVTLTFLCPYVIYSRVGRDAAVSPVRAVLGVATYLLLFLELRLADDFDDYESDQRGDEQADAYRSRLQGLLAAAAALAVVLNLGSPLAAATVLAATAAAAGPAALKHTTAARTWVLAACYEASPLLLAVYPYVAWRATHAPVPGARLIISGSGLVWTLYEYWKFSRSYNDGPARPHGLPAAAARAIMLLLLGGICACWTSVFLIVPHPLPPLTFALAVCAGPAWLIWRRRGDRWLGWSGLIVAGVLEVYVVITTLIAR